MLLPHCRSASQTCPSSPADAQRTGPDWTARGGGGDVGEDFVGGDVRRLTTAARCCRGVAHKWADWLRNPCHLGGSPTLQSGGESKQWPTNGRIGYITPAVWGPQLFRAGDKNRSPLSCQRRQASLPVIPRSTTSDVGIVKQGESRGSAPPGPHQL